MRSDHIKIIAMIGLSGCLLLSHLLFAKHTTPDINWYTEDYPPFNYQQEGRIKGIAIDLLKKSYAELGWSLDQDKIKIMPWPRVYFTLENEENACVFSMTYTKQRAEHFNFVGSVMPNTIAIIGHSDSHITEKELHTNKNLRFGVVKNDIGHETLLQYGIPEQQYVYLKSGFDLVRMLQHKRVDLIAYGEVIASYQFKKADINPDNFKVTKALLKSNLGFACNKHIPMTLLNKLDQTIKQISGQQAGLNN